MLGRIIRWLFLLALLGGAVVAFYLRATQVKKASASKRIPRVKVQRPSVRGMLVRLSYPATLEPIQAAEVRPIEAKGFVRKLTVDKGDKVKRGQLLATVDCPEYHARRRQATEAIRSVKAMRDNALVLRDRLEPMRKQGFVSQLELDNAIATYEATDARLKNEEARLAEIEQLLGFCTIRAPFTGEVAMRFVDVGEQVRPGGGPLLSLIRRDAMRVQVRVPERDALHVREDVPAELTVQGLPGESFFGKLTRFVRSVDLATRTMLVEIEIPNPNGILKPAMFGRVVLTVARIPRAIMVPATAVLATDTGVAVFVVSDGKALKVPVRMGYDQGDEVQISQGLRGREQVIVAGRDLITDGQPVDVVEDSPLAERPAREASPAAGDDNEVRDDAQERAAPPPPAGKEFEAPKTPASPR